MHVGNTSINKLDSKSRYEPINDKFCTAVKLKRSELKDFDVKALFKEFNEYLVTAICDNRDGILLPHYLGLLFIGVFPGKSNNLTWELRESKKEAAYSIYDRDGFQSRLFYSTTRTKKWFAAGKFWGLVPSVPANEKKHDAFVADWKKYIVIPNTRFMNNIVTKKAASQVIQKRKEETLKTYNEFDFN